jgi:FAD/FMN-containing dehydrogenase
MTRHLQPLDLERLRRAFPGTVLGPGDDEFDSARDVFYGGEDVIPAAVAQVESAEDVARVVTFAAENGHEIAVKGGGHSLARLATTSGGIVIDLARMKGLEIDPAGKTAWAQAGLTTGEYTKAAGSHGLATGFGDTPSVGLSGITLSGGIGFLVRKHGLTIDSLLAAEVVTADGRILQVNEENEPDLFWALRGGGGNFGVVTRFQFRLHEVDEVVGGMLILPATAEVVAGFVEEAAAAPDELSTILNVMVAPPLPFLPESVHGKKVALGLLAYTGDVDAGQKVMDRFRGLAEPLVDTLAAIHYPELFMEEEGDGPPFKPQSASRNAFIDSFDDQAAAFLVDALDEAPAMMTAVQIRALGGEMARVPAESTAFVHRDRPFMVNLAAMYMDPAQADPTADWIVRTADGLLGDDYGSYTGFMTNEDFDRAYPGATGARLRTVKRAYDPDNLFHRNHNIEPA